MTEPGNVLNATVATMAAILGWLAVEAVDLHGKAASLGAASGIVAGLVAIAPSCGTIAARRHRDRHDRRWGLHLGGRAEEYQLGLDDSMDVSGVRLVGGILGTVLIGLF